LQNQIQLNLFCR